MPFDPSIISKIPLMGPNPMNARLQAYGLKDLIDTEQTDQLRYHEAKKADEDTANVRGILSKQDLSTPDGMHRAASALTQGGYPERAMQLLSASRTLSAENLQAQKDQLQILQLASTVVGPAALSVRDVLQTQGLAAAQQFYKTHAAQLRSQIPASVQTGLPAQLPGNHAAALQYLNEVIDRSASARQILASRANLQKTQADTAESEARTKALNEGGKLVPVQMPDGRVEYVPTSQAAGKPVGTTGGRYGITNPQTQGGQQLKDQFIELTGGKVTLAQLRALNFDDLYRRGATAASIVQGGLTYTGQQRASSAAGQRAGNISVLEGSLGGAADQVRATLLDVKRGNVQSLNRLIAAGRRQFGNPAEARYSAAVQTLVNEYSRVVAGGTGASTDSARAEAMKLLNTAQTPAQVNAVLDQMTREVAIVKAASQRAMGSTGEEPEPGARSGGAAPPAPSAGAQPPGAATKDFSSLWR